jgi:predicted TIM-barrel fold metal-dependent hydrolase
MSHRRIDVHHHIMPPHYVDVVGTGPIGSQGSSGRVPSWSVEQCLALMDASGIATGVTSISSPGFNTLDENTAASLATWCNDFAADMVHSHPGRFGMFAALALHSVDKALLEVTRAYDSLGTDGVCLLSNYDGRYLGDERFRPLYEELERRQAVVFVHPTAPVHTVSVAGLSASTLEFPFDTTRTIASLIFSGVTTDFPSIRWIFSHAGGAMPYLAGRVEVLSRNNPALRERIPSGFKAALSGMYFDTALSANTTHMAALRDVVGDSQILFGTDYPFGPKDTMADTVRGLETVDLTPSARAAIETDNALKLFPGLKAA